jgi:hypothetical protein
MRHFLTLLAPRSKTRHRAKPSAPSRRGFRAECLERRLLLSATPLENPSVDTALSASWGILSLTNASFTQPLAGVQLEGGFIASDTQLVVLQTNGQPYSNFSSVDVVNLGGIPRASDQDFVPLSDSWISLSVTSLSGTSTRMFGFDSDGTFIPRAFEPTVAPLHSPEGGSISIPSLIAQIRQEVESPENAWASPSLTKVGQEEFATRTSLAHAKPAEISGEWAHAAVFSILGGEREPSAPQTYGRFSGISSAKQATMPVENISSPVRAAASDGKTIQGNTHGHPGALPSDTRGSDSSVTDSTHHTTYLQTPANRTSVPRSPEQDGIISKSVMTISRVRSANASALPLREVSANNSSHTHGKLHESNPNQTDTTPLLGGGKYRTLAASLITMLALDWVATVNSRQSSKLATANKLGSVEKPGSVNARSRGQVKSRVTGP